MLSLRSARALAPLLACVALAAPTPPALAQPRRADAGPDAHDATADAGLDARVRCLPEADDDDAGEAPRADASAARDGDVTDATDAGDAGDAGVACAPGRVVIDRAEHCCLPGQSWAVGRCAGAPTSCPPGESRQGDGCARRAARDVDAGSPTTALADAAVATAPAGMVAVAGGVFRAGGAWVSVGPYVIDRTEVTVAAYARCVTAGVCVAPVDPFGQMSSRPTSPVVNVTWTMASRYCGWAGGRLPTEAEWELAARGLDGRRYPWGMRAPDCARARHAGCGASPQAVGAAAAGRSPFGLDDMAGNVAEWTLDGFGPRASRDDDRVVSDPTGPATGARRVVRGGSFTSSAADVTAEARQGVDAREARGDVGFRCARGL